MKMNRTWHTWGVVTALLLVQPLATAQHIKPTATLHNGWRLTPVGAHQKISDMPLASALSPDKSLFAVVNAEIGRAHV